MKEEGRNPGWVWPLIGVVVVVALVVIGLNREPARYDPDTPEGIVQAYLAALIDGDFATAASLWADEGCRPQSIEPTEGAPDISASLARVDVDDDEATVVVDITGTSPLDPMGPAYEYQEWFTLVRRDGSWRILQPSWPYYDQPCEDTA